MSRRINANEDNKGGVAAVTTGGWGKRHGFSLSSLEMAMCFAVADRMQVMKQENVGGGVSETWLLEMTKGVAGKDTADYEDRLLNSLAALDTKGVLEKRRDDGAWGYVLTVVGQQVVNEERPGFVKGLSWLA